MTNIDQTPGMFTPRNVSPSPRIPRGARARRNLNTQFDREVNSPVRHSDMETPETYPEENCYSPPRENLHGYSSYRWRSWIVVLFLLGVCSAIGFIYRYYPVYLLLCLTSDFMYLLASIVSVLLFGFILYVI